MARPKGRPKELHGPVVGVKLPVMTHVQLQAAEYFGANGWMFWNPRNIYPASGYGQVEEKGMEEEREKPKP